MTDDPQRETMQAETARAKQKEGTGAVPNVAEEESHDEVTDLKKALHDYEEEKGDWSKTGG
jgi:hypothetical protein